MSLPLFFLAQGQRPALSKTSGGLKWLHPRSAEQPQSVLTSDRVLWAPHTALDFPLSSYNFKLIRNQISILQEMPVLETLLHLKPKGKLAFSNREMAWFLPCGVIKPFQMDASGTFMHIIQHHLNLNAIYRSYRTHFVGIKANTGLLNHDPY